MFSCETAFTFDVFETPISALARSNFTFAQHKKERKEKEKSNKKNSNKPWRLVVSISVENVFLETLLRYCFFIILYCSYLIAKFDKNKQDFTR